MQKFKKFIQQGLVAIVLSGASVGVVLAAPSFDITTLVSGFIRYTGIPHGHTATCADSKGYDYCYGYGWSGNLQAWGYGYGYKSKDFYGEVDTTQAAAYGFDGDDGSVTIDSIDITQTTATITYSTNYLARLAHAYTPNSDGSGFIGVEEEHDFNSGERIWSITGLVCDTTYYIGINAFDAGDNQWLVQDSFTTDACFDTPEPGSSPRTTILGSISGAGTKAGDPSSSLLRLPPITLALGSVGVDVQDLQILLNHIGVFLDNHGAGSPGEETEYFGKKTYAAVKAFQQVFDLKKVDGIYGPETQRVMYNELTK